MSFTWIDFYNELFLKIVENYDSKSLASLAYEIFPEKGLLDRDEEKNEFKLLELEPCTFLARFNRKEKYETRIAYCEKAKKILGLKSEVPKDFDGIPIFQNMAFWFFPWGYERKGFEIEALWKFARELVSNSISEETFKTAFKSKGAGLTYLTTICYIVHPKKYLPTDGRTSLYLEKRDKKLKDKIDEMRRLDSPYSTYQSFLKEVVELFPNKTCADISLSAYLEDVNDKAKESQIDTGANINYWVVGATWGDIRCVGEWIFR